MFSIFVWITHFLIQYRQQAINFFPMLLLLSVLVIEGCALLFLGIITETHLFTAVSGLMNRCILKSSFSFQWIIWMFQCLIPHTHSFMSLKFTLCWQDCSTRLITVYDFALLASHELRKIWCIKNYCYSSDQARTVGWAQPLTSSNDSVRKNGHVSRHKHLEPNCLSQLY